MKDLLTYINESQSKLPDVNRILYTALVLNDTSRKELEGFAKDKLKDNHDFNPEFFCHHMTIAFHTDLDDKTLKWVIEHEGTEYDITATQFGIDDKAMGVGVETTVPCKNTIKHVTLATNKSNKGKPVDTNYIKGWEPLEHKIHLKGTVTIIYKR